MASGDTSYSTSQSKLVLLLDAVAATSTNDGAWVDCAEFTKGTVVTTGATGAAVITIMARNDVAKPSNPTTGPAIATLAAGVDAFTSIPVLPRWIKSAITTLGTGTATSILIARRD